MERIFCGILINVSLKKLTVFIDYAVNVIRQNRRNHQAAQAAPQNNNNGGPGNNNNNQGGVNNREQRQRFLHLKLADLFDEKFFEDFSLETRRRCIEQLYESMFVSFFRNLNSNTFTFNNT